MSPDGEENILDKLFASARRLDPEAWAERDRLWRERGRNPDLLSERPRNAAERRMMDRRMHSIRLAIDEDLCGGDAALATALRELDAAAKH
jgi:hypothetical protein